MADISTDIANMSLDLLSAETVTNIEIPTTATESLVARWYNHCRRRLLRSHPWNFATKYDVIAAGVVQPKFGGKAFPVPPDFLRLLYVAGVENAPIPHTSYRMANVGAQRCIIMDGNYFDDVSALKLVYIFDEEDVSRFDDLFTELLAHDLAVALAFKVTGSGGVVDRINQLKKARQALSQSIDGQEVPPYSVQRSANRHMRRNLTTSRTDRIDF